VGHAARLSRARSSGSSRVEPAETALVEIYQPPFDNPNAQMRGFSPRGGDVDRNGVYWAALASGHLASFDRRKCKAPLNGPKATGQHCPEGWTLYTEPAAAAQRRHRFRQRRGELLHVGRSVRHARLGRNVPIDTGNASKRCSRSRTASS
jgi:hypothetical protein